MSKRRGRHRYFFSGEGKIDIHGNTPCVVCGALVSVGEIDPKWKAQTEREHPGQSRALWEEMIAECKTLCEECESTF